MGDSSPLVGVPIHCSLENRIELLQNVKVLCFVVGVYNQVLVEVKPPAVEEVEQNKTQGVNVCFESPVEGIVVSPLILRNVVVGSSAKQLLGGLLFGHAQSEVGNDWGELVHEEDVFLLQVKVDEVCVMHSLHSDQNLHISVQQIKEFELVQGGKRVLFVEKKSQVSDHLVLLNLDDGVVVLHLDGTAVFVDVDDIVAFGEVGHVNQLLVGLTVEFDWNGNFHFFGDARLGFGGVDGAEASLSNLLFDQGVDLPLAFDRLRTKFVDIKLNSFK